MYDVNYYITLALTTGQAVWDVLVNIDGKLPYKMPKVSTFNFILGSHMPMHLAVFLRLFWTIWPTLTILQIPR